MFEESAEGAKWVLGFPLLVTGKMGFEVPEMPFGHEIWALGISGIICGKIWAGSWHLTKLRT